MMCYRDRSFCNANCTPIQPCVIQLTEQVKQDADKWWGKPGAPIAVSDYSLDDEYNIRCKQYIKSIKSKEQT